MVADEHFIEDSFWQHTLGLDSKGIQKYKNSAVDTTHGMKLQEDSFQQN